MYEPFLLNTTSSASRTAGSMAGVGGVWVVLPGAAVVASAVWGRMLGVRKAEVVAGGDEEGEEEEGAAMPLGVVGLALAEDCVPD